MWSAKVPRRSESVARPRYKATSNDRGDQMPQRSKEKAGGLETKALNQLLKPNLEKIKRCLNDESLRENNDSGGPFGWAK